MKKLAIIGTTRIGSMMLCAVPLSLHFSHATAVSVALDTADARVGRPGRPPASQVWRGDLHGAALLALLANKPRGLR